MPLFFDLTEQKPLSGFSGASIFLASNGNIQFVRKVAKDKQTSNRLKLQAEKQKYFQSLNIKSIKIPKIINEGEIEDIYYFDMEYIEGQSAIDFIKNAEYKDISKFSDKLYEYFNSVKNLKNTNKFNIYQSLHQKATDVFSKAHSLSTDHMIAVLDNLYSLKDIDYIEETVCHGDLTLENMIVSSDGNIYLVDFLDSYVDHFYQDFSKIFQDVDGRWFERKNIKIDDDKIEMLSSDLKEIIEIIDPNYLKFHKILVMMNFLRILPYTHNEEEIEFVKSKLEIFL